MRRALCVSGIMLALWGGSWLLANAPEGYGFAAFCTAGLLFLSSSAGLVEVD